MATFPVLRGHLWSVAAAWDDTDTVCLWPSAHVPFPSAPLNAPGYQPSRPFTQVLLLLPSTWVSLVLFPAPSLAAPTSRGRGESTPHLEQSLTLTMACHFLSQQPARAFCHHMESWQQSWDQEFPSLFPDLFPHPVSSTRWS